MKAKIVRIKDKTWRIENEFVYYYLIEGEGSALLVDSGAFDEDVKVMAESLTKLPITLVNTHGDGDHLAGNKYFDSFYIHPEDY